MLAVGLVIRFPGCSRRGGGRSRVLKGRGVVGWVRGDHLDR